MRTRAASIRRRVAALGCPWVAIVALEARASVLPGFQETAVLTGLDGPTAIRFAPDGRIFVAERDGRLLAFSGLGDTTPDVVVDLEPNVTSFWDQGLLGLAIHPQFPTPAYVYVSYAVDAPAGQSPPVWNDTCGDPEGNGCPTRGRLSRFEVSANNTLIGAEQVLIDTRLCVQFSTHTVGDLAFGPEGALYMSGGDGASFNVVDHGQDGNPCGDPMGGPGAADDEGGALRSQDLRTAGDPVSYDGALLRFDASGPTPVAWPSNPLVGGSAPDDDPIVAFGLRNPFRFAFRPGTGEVWIADVGWNDYEELNRMSSPLAPVENFGWPCYEGGPGGSLAQPGYASTSLGLAICQNLAPADVVAPFYSYSHDEAVVPGNPCPIAGSSITAVAFYPGGSYPAEYHGAVFFGDSSRGCTWAMLPDAPGGTPNPANRRTFVWGSGVPLDLQIGPGGDLYWTDFENGRLVRIRYFSANQPPVAALAAAPTSGPAPLDVAFDASASSDADPGDVLGYAWDLDGDGIFDDPPLADSRFAQATYTQPGAVTAAVRVTDLEGASDAASVQISVANGPPVPVITEPAPSLLWRVGSVVPFAGAALDPDEGELPASALAWRTLLHHCITPTDCHTHPQQTWQDVASGSFVAPDHSYPSFLELELTATDSGIGGWLDPAWTRRRVLIFDNSAQTETLVGFPVLVELDATRIDYGRVQNAGQDLRFAAPDGTLLPHEIERWDESGTSHVWVRADAIDGRSAADFMRMYYGNPYAPDGQDPAAVWSAGYAGVWHLDESLADSTANANDGANQGSTGVAGRIGEGRGFDGGDWIDFGSAPSLAPVGALTLEAWIAIDDPGQSGGPRVLDKKASAAAEHGYSLEYRPAVDEVTVRGSGSDFGSAANVALDTGWHWLAARISGGSAAVWVDGVNRTTDATVTPLVATAQPLHLGRRSGGGDYFSGEIDEARVSNVARSDDWIAAQHLSMSDAFLSFGPEEQSAALSATATLLLAPETQVVDFQTSPPGLELTLGSEARIAPFAATLIVNSTTTLSATSPQSQGGVPYRFVSWSNGGAASHDLVAAPGLASLLASFCADTDGDGVCDADDDCPTVANADQADDDGDGVGQACDTCIDLPNPPFAGDTTNRTLVSGQLDDDADGRGNHCDMDFNQQAVNVGGPDTALMVAALAPVSSVNDNDCGPSGTSACGIHDLNGAATDIGGPDTAVLVNLLAAGTVSLNAAPNRHCGALPAQTCAQNPSQACCPPFSRPLGSPEGATIGKAVCQNATGTGAPQRCPYAN
jgi:glucose/arabinose dehydrogenase